MPQVWSEDGTRVIYGFISNGWNFLLIPVNGYLITVSKLISAISLTLSFSYYPIISTIISWFFAAAVGLAVILSPTHLKGKLFCAILLFFVPSNPEVFNLPLYAFWWASILLFLVSLWDEKNQSIGWRIGFLLIGGLSSPIIVLILPILYLRAYWHRQLQSERIIAIIGTIIAFIQILFIFKESAGQFSPFYSILKNTIPAFFGNFIIGNWFDSDILLWIAGGLIFSIVATWLFRDRNNSTTLLLFYLLLGSIGMTIIRVDPAIIHPQLAGPRYLFFPFLLLFWILIQNYFVLHSKTARILLSIIIMAAITNSIPVWSRQHDDLRWKDHVRSCSLFSDYTIPVQTDGKRASAWSFELSGKSCEKFSKNDFIASIKKDSENSTYPYSVEYTGYNKNSYTEIVSDTIRIMNSQKDAFSKHETNEVSLKLKRGDSILYHSDSNEKIQRVIVVGYEKEFITELPSSKSWILLEFSNSKLPVEFTVKIMDI